MAIRKTPNNNNKIVLSDVDILNFIIPLETDTPEQITKKIECFRHLMKLINSLKDSSSWNILYNILGDYIQLIDEEVIDAWLKIAAD